MSNKNTLLTICSPPIYRRFKGGLLNKKTFPARQRLSRGFAKAQVQILGICKNQYVTNQNYFRHWLVQIKNSQADAGMLKKGHFNFLTYSLLLAPCSAPPRKATSFSLKHALSQAGKEPSWTVAINTFRPAAHNSASFHIS